MPWFNVDDGFAFHRKAMLAGNAALGLWVRSGSWCAQQLTEGFVPHDMVEHLGTATQAKKLVRAGLWEPADGGYQFHEWSAEGRNPTRAEVAERRRRERERKATARAAKKSKTEKSAKPQDNEACPPGNPDGVPGGIPQGVPGGVRSTTPLHSPPIKEEKKTTSSSGPRKRGTRIPDDFAVTAEMVAWARDRVPHVDGRLETEKFINYWCAATGQKAMKRDWEATWRNWMLNAAERATQSRAPAPLAKPSTTDQRVAAAQALKARLATNGATVLQLPSGEPR